MFGHNDFMWFGGGVMWLFWVLLVVFVVVALRWAFGRGDSAPDRTGNQDKAMTILRQRYARGEIDEAEFHRRQQELEE